MKRAIVLLALLTAASCVSKPKQVEGGHLITKTGTISLEGVHSVRFQTKDGFQVSASGIRELIVSETTVCGMLDLYRPSSEVKMPAWAERSEWAASIDSDEYYPSFTAIKCVARDNIASTTMTVGQTDLVASTTCVALLPLCALAYSVPGQ